MVERLRPACENRTTGMVLPMQSAEPLARDGPMLLVDENLARDALLVMALEREEATGLLPKLQSAAATEQAWAGAHCGECVLSDGEWIRLVLEPRTSLIVSDVGTRCHSIRILRDESVARRHALELFLSVAFFTGLFGDRLSNPEYIDLIAAPLGLFIAWNWLFISYSFFRFFWPSTGSGGRPGFWLGLGHQLLTRRASDTPDLVRVAQAYHFRWIEAAGELMRARVKRTQHGAAIAVAMGALVSLLWAAWHKEFRVGWASTLCRAPCVHLLHSAFFYPTQFLPQSIAAAPFSLEEISELHHWERPDRGEGERWLRLVSLMLLTTVVMPRAGLVMMWSWRIDRLRKSVPLNLGDPYFQRLRHPPVKPSPTPTSEPSTGDPNPDTSRPKRLRDWWRRIFREASHGNELKRPSSDREQGRTAPSRSVDSTDSPPRGLVARLWRWLSHLFGLR